MLLDMSLVIGSADLEAAVACVESFPFAVDARDVETDDMSFGAVENMGYAIVIIVGWFKKFQ